MKVNKISTEQAILRFLKKESHSYLSGQALSKAFGISRTAIWKHMNAIKEMGYSIEASPAKGYRLNLQNLPFNAIEIATNLNTSFIAKNLSFYNKIESTNDTAKEFAANDAKEGFTVVADYQKKGKGRLGRRWESPAGVNIYTSIILRPNIMPVFAPQLTLVAAVAVAETVAKFLNPPTSPFSKGGLKDFPPLTEGGMGGFLSVKWPNDILINSKKVAGILTEMDSEADRINFVILGIGINVNVTKKMLPPELKSIATSLKEETGKEVSRTDLLQTLYLNIETWYKKYLKEGFELIREAWNVYFKMAGKVVRIRQLSKTVEGIAMGIDTDGALLLQDKGGSIIKIISGEIELYTAT
ncbi:MAG: biotin--[acetyl-CoA-carboxylase] ligase [Deltaproteobacteria bacterium RIFOXYA2_FULL_42_10]|nr:MAG: biotin--[acetyl-CoA-carboxylase] ligase [Deltaproteobacteria bacterium RIFOXYA2_FULL_42_10]